MSNEPPIDIDTLMQRARRMAGRTIAQLAESLDRDVPADLRSHKGWLGELIEDVLGATGGSRPQVDFPQLGVELKTLPVDSAGKPRESTWVCSAPLDGFIGETWETSRVRAKLAHVLWVPVLAEPHLSLSERRLGTALLWAMDPESEVTLREDWEELSELIRLGHMDQIDARKGTWLQLRPKAASSKVTRVTLDAEGEWVHANPKGFYLRTAFTKRLLATYWRHDPRNP
jgi:DNA mismatch repair protein MutH